MKPHVLSPTRQEAGTCAPLATWWSPWASTPRVPQSQVSVCTCSWLASRRHCQARWQLFLRNRLVWIQKPPNEQLSIDVREQTTILQVSFAGVPRKNELIRKDTTTLQVGFEEIPWKSKSC